MLVEELRGGLREPAPQDGEPTYAAKLTPEDLHLDWTLPAVQRDRVVRLGGAWTTFRGNRLKVLAAELVAPDGIGADMSEDPAVVGGLRLVTVQPEGRGPMPFRDFDNGAHPRPGERLG